MKTPKFDPKAKAVRKKYNFSAAHLHSLHVQSLKVEETGQS